MIRSVVLTKPTIIVKPRVLFRNKLAGFRVLIVPNDHAISGVLVIYRTVYTSKILTRTVDLARHLISVSFQELKLLLGIDILKKRKKLLKLEFKLDLKIFDNGNLHLI